MPPKVKQIKPHPYGIELGTLISMMENSKEKTIYIGDDEEGKAGTVLIEYKANESIYSEHFFDRWDQTLFLMFEFTILGKNDEPFCCIKGFWDKNKWLKLDINHKNKIEIVTKD